MRQAKWITAAWALIAFVVALRAMFGGQLLPESVYLLVPLGILAVTSTFIYALAIIHLVHEHL